MLFTVLLSLSTWASMTPAVLRARRPSTDVCELLEASKLAVVAGPPHEHCVQVLGVGPFLLVAELLAHAVRDDVQVADVDIETLLYVWDGRKDFAGSSLASLRFSPVACRSSVHFFGVRTYVCC